MDDIIAAVLIALSFGVFYGTVQFCAKVAEEQGGEDR